MSLSILICRGCCCGTDTKHPDTDHTAQVQELTAAIDGIGRTYTVDCLGPCERSNVIVVRTGRRRRWFGHILTPDDTTALARWLAAGAPGEPPEPLAPHEFGPADTSTADPPGD